MKFIRKKNLIKTAISASLLLSLAGCSSDSDETLKFTVLHTNDNHGRFWHNSDGEYGMAARQTLINRLREQVAANGGEVLLLSGGDINTGVPESDLLDAEPDFIGMSHIRYDAMAVGNHEFDNPRDVLEKQQAWASFPMLSANIYKKDTGERLFKPYEIFNVNGVKIAVIGLTTEDTGRIGNPEYVSDLEFRNTAEEAAKVIAEIEANESVDVILATTHMGHYEDGNNGSNAPGDVTLARSLAPGKLDAIIGGHSQNPVCMEPGTNNYNTDFKPGDECVPDQQNGTYIMQAHEWGKYVGRADFEFRGDELKLVSYELIPVNLKEENEDGDKVFIGEEIEKDPALYSILEEFQNKGDEALGNIIATLNGKLEGDRNVVRSQQTNLGRLIAAAQTDAVPNADFGVMNSGGVRDSINAEGINGYDVSYRDVLIVQPFGNTIGRVEMSGAAIAEYLGDVATKQIESGAYAQFSGVNMAVDCAAGTVAINSLGDKDYSPEDSYIFTIPSFNANGGDNYPILDFIDTGKVDADELKRFFETKQVINAADYEPQGEVVYLNSLSDKGCQLAP
ncbi:5'-nucleotidase [Photobacterium gaetbulicola]|uniref:5'-nucleotidase n=1 Tax=Photobacterium gaetbulicola TaxID=1295392 RepID=A0A0B9H394_9GAMM|nr:5'-nucleotidase [Photobacterium gaetbulicola]